MGNGGYQPVDSRVRGNDGGDSEFCTCLIFNVLTPEENPTGGVEAAEVALSGRVRGTVSPDSPDRTVLRTFRW